MKRLLFILITIGVVYSCKNTHRNPSIESTHIHSNLKNEERVKGEEDYLEIKRLFEQGFYLDLDRRISQFYEYEKESSFLDSVKMIEKELIDNRKKNKYLRDSLFHLSLIDYIEGLNLPRLESISTINYNLDHSYKNDFNDIDKQLFKTDWTWNWYLSKQLSGRFICVAVCRFVDCENSIVLYSIDSDKNIIDMIELYSDGCYTERETNFRFKKYIINQMDRESKYSEFHGDTAFTITSWSNFTLKDTLTNNILTETGYENKLTYKVDSLGKFKVVRDESFKKEYVEPFLKHYFN